MMKGIDPRSVLSDMIASDTVIPEGIDQLTLWKLILNMLSVPPKRKKLDFVNTLENVAALIKQCRNIVVLTGAGVSFNFQSLRLPSDSNKTIRPNIFLIIKPILIRPFNDMR